MVAYSVSVTLPTLRRHERPPLEMEIHQAEYHHDLAIYTLPDQTGGTTFYRPGTPVNIRWSQGRSAGTFFGSVDHVEPGTQAGDPTLQVWCIGASSPFNDGLQKQFYGRTFPSVVNDISRSLQLDVSAVAHDRVFDAITFPGGRMWDTLVDYAKQIGYSFYVNNTRVELHPRTAIVDRFGTQAPVFRRQTNGANPGSLHTFSPISGAEQPGHYRVNRSINGVDYRTGVPFRADAGVAVGKLGRETVVPTATHYQNIEVSTPVEARHLLRAMTENRRFNITAMAVTDGEPRIRQMWPVLLGGVEPQYVGLWCATKVVHRFNQQDYWMELELGRDAAHTTVPLPDPKAKRVAVPRNTPQGRQKAVYPPSVLVNGQWRSQWSSASRTFGSSG